ncbi:hypothetical protein Tco_0633970 [Tanacetum coccineum]
MVELKRRNMKKTDSDIQYTISIKEDTAYLCLHFTKDHEGNKINTPYPGTTNTPYSSYGLRKKYRLNLKYDMSPRDNVFTQKINRAYSDPLNTAYRSSDTESESEILSYLPELVD